MMLLDNSQIVNKSAQAAAFNFAYNASNADLISFQVHGTQVSSGTGTIKLQASLDGITYFDVSGDSLIINGAVSALWTINPVVAKWYNVNYAATSGATNFTVTVFAGVLGTGS